MSDFIRGVLVDEEVAGYTIYIDVFKRRYGAHFSLITDLNTYYYETMRMLQRGSLALALNTTTSSSLHHLQQHVEYARHPDKINVYVHKSSTRFGDNLKLERNVCIGANCSIGNKCELLNCYVAAGCVIGNNVKLTNSIVLANTRIGSGCHMNATLVGTRARIGNNCRFVENVLIAARCHVKDETVISQRGVFYNKDVTIKTMLQANASKCP